MERTAAAAERPPSRTATRRPDDPMLGRLLDGRYRIEDRIARGGMATVYLGTDTRLDRAVAIKVMHPGLGDDDEFARRFVREARSAARLGHHNVVAVFDQGDDDGTLYLVMEYVPGRTLRDLIREEAPMPPDRALAVLEPVLSALGAAHAAGLVHRDVKPENVLLGDEAGSSVKVADFGLARAVNAETQHTGTTGVLIGTVSYLSPELVVDGVADARADVYAAGVIAFEMLTGSKPHQAESPIQVAYKHVHEDIPAPSTLVAGLPSSVDALVGRATARDADQRPADATVLLGEVRRVRAALGDPAADAALAADLAPGAIHGTGTAGDLPRVIVDPSAPDPGAGFRSHYSPDDVYDQDAEKTSSIAAGAYQARAGYDQPDAYGPRDPRRPAPARTIAPLPRSARPSRRGPFLLALLLLTAVAVALGGWWLGVARYTTTPGLLQLTPAAAQARLTQAGLHYHQSGTGYSETIAKGLVLSTAPAPGARVLKNGTVDVVISRGPERHPVPAVEGKTPEQARAAMTGARLTYGQEVFLYSDTVARGLVVRTQPKAGTELRRNTPVDVVISKGPRPIQVPDETGKPFRTANDALTTLGFQVTASRAWSDTVPRGRVIAQTPSNGTLFKGQTVTLQVSKGPRLVQVPSVRGEGIAAAKKQLEALGFRVRTVPSSMYLGLGFVANSDPSPGSAVPRGSLITLSVV